MEELAVKGVALYERLAKKVTWRMEEEWETWNEGENFWGASNDPVS